MWQHDAVGDRKPKRYQCDVRCFVYPLSASLILWVIPLLMYRLEVEVYNSVMVSTKQQRAFCYTTRLRTTMKHQRHTSPVAHGVSSPAGIVSFWSDSRLKTNNKSTPIFLAWIGGRYIDHLDQFMWKSDFLSKTMILLALLSFCI